MRDRKHGLLIRLLLSIAFLLAVFAIAKNDEKHQEYGKFFSDLEE